MPLTKEQLEQSPLFKNYKFKRSAWEGKELGVEQADLYVSESHGLSIGVHAPDGIAIDLLRVSGRQPWSQYSEEVRGAVMQSQLMIICEYVIGDGAGLDMGKYEQFRTSFNVQLEKAAESGDTARAIIDGCEITYLCNQSEDVVGFQAETARAQNWDAEFPDSDRSQ